MNGDAGAGPHSRRSEDVAATVYRFACLARVGDITHTSVPDPDGGTLATSVEFRDGMERGRHVEQELIARIAAMAAGWHRPPVHIPYDAARAASADYQQGMAAGRRLVHESLLVSHRMVNGQTCPRCDATGVNDHAADCSYA
ncbi:hypothetical protein ACFQZ4_36990 [Catellatospora coxensis]|uniref:Uncharacterized protein n=1 Tax=Catellatospora coxensis TaxID=310354 RepID=A0A8J3KZ75_9ACTN|nr:hypothetical protein [Catellatospora coxensis]GIG03810.1 hypothetical protein Cco03nite_05100 [Catellatospora coxensis]